MYAPEKKLILLERRISLSEKFTQLLRDGRG